MFPSLTFRLLRWTSLFTPPARHCSEANPLSSVEILSGSRLCPSGTIAARLRNAELACTVDGALQDRTIALIAIDPHARRQPNTAAGTGARR